MFSETGEGEGGSTFLLPSPASMQKLPNIKEEGKKVKKKKTGSNLSNMRRSVSSPDEIPRRELKIRRAAEYF